MSEDVSGLPESMSVSACRFLYLVGQLRRGGLERQLYYLLQAMDRTCYRPAVVVWSYQGEEPYKERIQALGVPCYSFASLTTGSAKMTAFRRLLRELQPAVAHSYSFYTNIAAQWATRGTQTIPVGSVRSALTLAKKDSGWWLGNLSARWPRTQICNSVSAFNEMRQAGRVFAPKHPFVVCNGIDFEGFPHVPMPQLGGPPIIVGVGSLVPVKRWDRLIEAAHTLKNQGFTFGVRIVGDGPLRSSLSEYACELGVADRVQLTGPSDEVPRILSEARFIVHTSDSEGCPNVVMEAMACGRAVVATAVGDVPLLIDDGTIGFVVPCDDLSLLTTHMATLLSQPELCQHMGAAARTKAERLFSLDRLVAETLAVYRAAGWKDR